METNVGAAESPGGIVGAKAAEAMATSVDVLLCCFLLVIALIIAYITKKYRFIYLPESGTSMVFLPYMLSTLVSAVVIGHNLRVCGNQSNACRRVLLSYSSRGPATSSF